MSIRYHACECQGTSAVRRSESWTTRFVRSNSWACVTLLLLCEGFAFAKTPEIANLYPDFVGSGDAPKIITGEGFDPASTRIWTWSPPSDEAVLKEALTHIDKGVPPLPAKPPKGAQSQDAIDVETQVIVANVRGSVMWVQTADGVSKPLMFNRAKPCWLSESKATPGSIVYVFGFGMRQSYGKTTIAVTGDGGTFYPPRIVEARAYRTADSRLVTFEVPKQIKPGPYAVYIHNGMGGQWGWRKAGDLEAVSASTAAEKIFDVREFGAKGDGLANDYIAISSAIKAAYKAGGGTVFFPPGTFVTDVTIVVPSGVNLRGASRKSCVLRGFGDASKATRRAWFHRTTPPTAVVRLYDNTSLELMTVEGATWKGQGSHSLVEALPSEIIFPAGGRVHNVTVVDCCLRANEEDPKSRRPLYRSAFYCNPDAYRIKVLSNEIFGGLGWGTGGSAGQAVRVDIIGNKIHGGGLSDVVTIGGSFSQSLIDDNTLVDTPGRICVGMGWHNYFRFNEIHQAFRSTWENAEEVYLVHGGVESSKTIGFATGGSIDTLADKQQNWKPDFYYDATLMVISGRGFGQYRRVIGNTKDTLRLEKRWNVMPDSTTEYLVSPLFTENAFFANLNNTPCRLSFWLDSVANVVEMQRDDHAKGMDMVASDDSKVDEKGVASQLRKFFPTYYNMFVNGWMDGSAAWVSNSGGKANNAHRGYSSFGNFVVGNRIRQPHEHRTGFYHHVPRDAAGISISGGSDRTSTSHTIVSNNFLASTYTGIRVDSTARKTLVLSNEFDHVDTPIDDRGALTLIKGNRLTGSRGTRGEAIPDMRSKQHLTEWTPRPWKPAPSETILPLVHDVEALKYLVSEPLYTACTGVDSIELQTECRTHLRQLFGVLKQYDAKKGHLPEAAFFPRHPLRDADSLAVILGTTATKLLICPTCSPEWQTVGLNYVWNEKLNGQTLADLQPDTWLMMDCAAAHEWMVSNHYCGHLGQVNVLYADGTVKLFTPFSVNDWKKSPSGTWEDWARQ